MFIFYILFIILLLISLQKLSIKTTYKVLYYLLKTYYYDYIIKILELIKDIKTNSKQVIYKLF
jgi:hypothetical protein